MEPGKFPWLAMNEHDTRHVAILLWQISVLVSIPTIRKRGYHCNQLICA